jgi:hypothetical protein
MTTVVINLCHCRFSASVGMTLAPDMISAAIGKKSTWLSPLTLTPFPQYETSESRVVNG